MITDIVTEYTLERQRESTERWLARKRAYGEPKLSAGDVGHCWRKCFWSAFKAWPEHQLHQPVTNPFSFYVEDVMFSGNVWEDTLAPAIADGVHNYEVVTEHWGGEIDVLLRQNGLWHVIELKDTAEHNFRQRGGLPYQFHCAQVLTYQRLLKEQEGLKTDDVECRLYYHGRGHRAEFVVWQTDGYLVYDGHVDGYDRAGEFDFDLGKEIDELEYYWAKQELPPAYPTPFYKPFGECVSGSKSKGFYPGCIYFGACWGMPEGPFTEDDWPG